jgi:drug/metabolite transporter (DMT)-like permease
MPIFELAALAAALTWALGGILSPTPAAHLGTIGFNRIRLTMMFVLLAGYVAIAGSWQTIPTDKLAEVMLSGLVGIFLGDTALFATMNRLGPRRTAMLFSLNAPMSAVLGYIFLAEALSGTEVTGILIVTAGVVLAIAFGKRRSQLHQWEAVKGPLWIGIVVGLVAALGQSVGSLIASPILSAGADPIAVSCLRVGVAAFFLNVLGAMPITGFKVLNALNLRIAGLTFLSGFLGMAVGMTLVLFALSGGEVGIVSTLSATTPAMLLPLLWIKTRERPALLAWVGAALVAIGSGLIFSS